MNTNPNSDTPRTDEAWRKYANMEFCASQAIAVSHQLERELADTKKLLIEAELVVKEARKDSERLDWLDRDCFTCGTNADGPVFVTSAENGEDYFGDTFRAAIDAAKAST